MTVSSHNSSELNNIHFPGLLKSIQSTELQTPWCTQRFLGDTTSQLSSLFSVHPTSSTHIYTFHGIYLYHPLRCALRSKKYISKIGLKNIKKWPLPHRSNFLIFIQKSKFQINIFKTIFVDSYSIWTWSRPVFRWRLHLSHQF